MLASLQQRGHRVGLRKDCSATNGVLRVPLCMCLTRTTSSGSRSVMRRALNENSQKTHLVSVVSSYDEALTQPLEVEESTAPAAQGAFDALPSRYKMLLAANLAFVICNMDKVNMSVAIIPMALEFGWSPSVAGTIQASFFYGYMLSQLPGGYLASTFGGRKVLPAGVALWSAMTCMVPSLASTIPGLSIARAGVGLGEAVAPSGATDMIARSVPAHERSRAVSFVFAGLHLGSIAGLIAAPFLIHHFGWESVFYVFGASGLAWSLWFETMMTDMERTDPEYAALLRTQPSSAAQPSGASNKQSSAITKVTASQVADNHRSADPHGAVIDSSMSIPYRAFLRSTPVQALCFTHFCHNWLHYTLLAWLPSYFVDEMNVDLLHAAQTALFPPMAGIVTSMLAGPAADALLGKGLPVGLVRKLMQGSSFLFPFAFLLWISQDGVSEDSTLSVALISATLGMSSLSLAGLYCTHQDMSPKYASALLGLTNTAGALPGIIGVATVGFLLDKTSSWQISLFLPSAVFMILGAYAYIFHAKNSPIDFDSQDNSKFAIEKWVSQLRFPSVR